MVTNPNPVTILTPKGIDFAIGNINANLASGLSWLTTAYGMTFPVKEGRSRRPMIHVGESNNEQALSLYKDDLLGNYCFWDLRGEERIQKIGVSVELCRVPLGLIFFWDYKTVFTTDFNRKTIIHVKEQIMQILKIPVNGGHLNFTGAELRPDKVWDGYMAENDNGIEQMRPFGSLRINIELVYKNPLEC